MISRTGIQQPAGKRTVLCNRLLDHVPVAASERCYFFTLNTLVCFSSPFLL
jgi:hypothetical protein